MTPPRFDDAFCAKLDELIAWRRDVRRFRRDPVPRPLVPQILRLAQRSPSVGNSQPWRWIEVASAGKREAVKANFRDCNAAALAVQEQTRAASYARLKLEGLDAAPAHRRGRPPGPPAPGRLLEAGQALDHLPRPGLRAKKNARDRLMRLAASHPDWVLGFQDETWWSRLALPSLHAWAGKRPLRLLQREADKADPDPKALSCYGLLRADTGGMLLRFVDGRPVSCRSRPSVRPTPEATGRSARTLRPLRPPPGRSFAACAPRPR